MPAREERLKYLMGKYGQQKATESETAEMLDLLKQEYGNEAVNFIADDIARITKMELPEASWNRIWQRVQHAMHQPAVIPSGRFRWWAVAALFVVLVTGVAVVMEVFTDKPPKVMAVKPRVKDVQPGKEGAVLTLADGSTIVLDERGNGMVASQNGVKVLLVNGQLTYKQAGRSFSGNAYNTMSTPKGRMFRLLLPDGSKVWLNAASSLRYPTAFTGRERKVEVTGEAYFEIAKNANMPFRVKVNEATTIEVLGTHFNINSYADEAHISATLLEGSIRVLKGEEKIILKPGQQAQMAGKAIPSRLTSQSKIRIVNEANVEKVMAWKNGLFNFQDADLEEVMRQLERWYDIEVVYKEEIPKIEFIGKMGRDLTLSEVLRGLEISKVHFRMEGRRLVVLP